MKAMTLLSASALYMSTLSQVSLVAGEDTTISAVLEKLDELTNKVQEQEETIDILLQGAVNRDEIISGLSNKADRNRKSIKNAKSDIEAIQSNQMDTADIRNKIQRNSDAIKENKDKIWSNFEYMFSNELDISSNQTQIKFNTATSNDNSNQIGHIMQCNEMFSAALSEEIILRFKNSNDISNNTINISKNTQTINDMYNSEMSSGDMDHDSNTVNICTGDYMSVTGEYCGEWVGARRIVKLPMWGVQEEDSDNYFQYPQLEDFARWQPNVQLRNIRFGVNEGVFASIEVEMNNGQSYETFDSDGCSQCRFFRKWTFEQPISTIRAVGATLDGTSIEQVTLYEEDGREICFDPSQIFSTDDDIQYSLKDNQELLGVYGVKDPDRKILKSFGFLVKEKNLER